MKRYNPANHIPLLWLLPWDGGLKNRTFTQHLVGQKMYELTSHLGNVQAVISDQRYVRVNEDDTRLFRAAVPALYDYYPFGMLMKERTTQDTATHSMTATQIVNVPNMVTAPLPLTGWSSVYGAAISYSGGVVAGGYTGGMSRSLGGLVPGVMATITLELKYVRKAPCHITVTDDVTSAVIASQSVGSGGFYSLSFTPTGNNVTLSIVEGVSFASSDKLIHLVTGTYTQQQGWTTAPLAVQLTNKDADKYKFGFNGQEKVNEIAGIGNHTTALFWEYDTRLGRRWNRDPVPVPEESPYAANRNNPIQYSDNDGDFPWFGAVAGVLIDAAMQGIAIYTGAQDEFSFSSLLISGVAGATGVGLSGVVERGIGRFALQGTTRVVVSTAADVGANTGLGIVEDITKDYFEDGKIDNDIDFTGNLLQASAGKVAENFVSGAVKNKVANSPQAKQLEKQAERLERVAKNNPKESPNTNRNKAPKEARAKHSDYVNGRAVKAGIVAGGGAGTGAKKAHELIKNNRSDGKLNVSVKPCFVAGTLVATPKGLVEIENIQDGDSVLSYNTVSKRLEYQIVEDKHQSVTDSIVTILLPDGEKIETTPAHSFYVNEGRWVPAGQLTIRDRIWFANGTRGSIKHISIIAREEIVYNFEVPITHNYFVSKAKILVHNSEDLKCK